MEDKIKVSLEGGINHYMSRKILQSDTVICTQVKYDSCFGNCPPMIPEPPPPPASLKDYKRSWCTGHDKPWKCVDTNYGPVINGSNPRFTTTISTTQRPGLRTAAAVSLGVVIPCVAIFAIVAVILLVIRRNRRAFKKKADNTYNLGYLSKPQAPTWTDNDGTEVAVEDGSEIFYQVDRTALSAGINGGGNTRSMPDVVHSSSATLRRSGSATSQAPLLSSPEIAAHNRRRNGNRTISTGQETKSDLGSPTYTRYGTTSHQPVSRKRSHESPSLSGTGATTLGAGTGYMTYSPTTKSHPSLYSEGERPENTGTTVRTPKARQRSFGNSDNKPRPLRKPSAASNVQRSDSMTLNRAGGRENYKTNWENFDEVTATMRKNKNGPSNRELVLGTDSFIDSFTTPEQEEATSVDQLGLPTRNPFLTGYYDYEADGDSTAGANARASLDMEDHPANDYGSPRHDVRSDYFSSRSDRESERDSERPPSYEEVIPPVNRTPSVNMSQAPTLDLRGKRDRISEYDSEASIEV